MDSNPYILKIKIVIFSRPRSSHDFFEFKNNTAMQYIPIKANKIRRDSQLSSLREKIN